MLRPKAKKSRRPLFTDGWNSFWHVCFGCLALQMYVLIPNFIMYQLVAYTDVNLWIDLAEFFLGLCVAWVLSPHDPLGLRPNQGGIITWEQSLNDSLSVGAQPQGS